MLFHTDAVQAYTQVPIDVEAMNIDMLSASAHKIHGPKGIGFLYIRRGVKIRSFVHGGAQERRRRAGTENVSGIIGFAKAAEVATKNMEEIYGQGAQGKRLSDRPHREGDSVRKIKRRQGKASAEQRKFLLPFY